MHLRLTQSYLTLSQDVHSQEDGRRRGGEEGNPEVRRLHLRCPGRDHLDDLPGLGGLLDPHVELERLHWPGKLGGHRCGKRRLINILIQE